MKSFQAFTDLTRREAWRTLAPEQAVMKRTSRCMEKDSGMAMNWIAIKRGLHALDMAGGGVTIARDVVSEHWHVASSCNNPSSVSAAGIHWEVQFLPQLGTNHSQCLNCVHNMWSNEIKESPQTVYWLIEKTVKLKATHGKRTGSGSSPLSYSWRPRLIREVIKIIRILSGKDFLCKTLRFSSWKKTSWGQTNVFDRSWPRDHQAIERVWSYKLKSQQEAVVRYAQLYIDRAKQPPPAQKFVERRRKINGLLVS